MPSKNISSSVSADGTQIQLMHTESGQVIETLPLIKALPEHKAFIISTWVKSYAGFNRKCRTVLNGSAGSVRSEDFSTGEAQIAERLWDKSYVVSGKEDTFTVNAWICGEKERIYYAYVPPDLRHHGLFSALAQWVVKGPACHIRLPWPYKKVEGLWMSYNPYCWLPVVRPLAQQPQ